ncbi:MAG TPA: MFS transporter [Candidatus Dormibacteraeota bacterium]|nr:MFS transporter [Candidatus Dormibacteraeota bacterium]
MWNARRLIAIMCAGVLLAQIDTSVVNLILRHVQAAFDAPFSALRWVVDGYNVAYGATILASGALADRYGRRAIFLLGIAVFTGGSLLCALAPNIAALVAGRVVAGIGGALEMPATLAILTLAFDEPLRARALGAWASMNGLAFIVGPTAGGLLAGAFGWRSVFLLAVPLGVLILASGGALPETRGARAHAEALGLFADRPFGLTLAAIAAMTFGMYGMLFLTPYLLQTVAHRSVTETGLLLLPMSVAFVLTANLAGALSGRIGRRAIATLGMTLMASGCAALAVTDPRGTLGVIGAMTLTGVGLGCATASLLGFAAERAPNALAGSASAYANAARMAGATLGVLFASYPGGAVVELAGALAAFAAFGAGQRIYPAAEEPLVSAVERCSSTLCSASRKRSGAS